MTRRISGVVAAILLLIGAASLLVWKRRIASNTPPVTGRLNLSWKGQSSGSTSLPVELDWCPIDRTGRLWAVSGDTGVVIVFYEADTLHLNSHQVIAPSIPVPPRPSATVAIRWAGDSTLSAFTSLNGTIDLNGASQQSVSGMFTLTLHHPSKSDTIRVTGSFSRVPTLTKTAGCP